MTQTDNRDKKKKKQCTNDFLRESFSKATTFHSFPFSLFSHSGFFFF
jgi:hypothetical protein